MTRIYLEEATASEPLEQTLVRAGYEVVRGSPPEEPEPGDLVLFSAHAGITPALRHRLNNPLTAVLGFAELLLREDPLSEGVERRANQIQENALRVREILQRTAGLRE
jgi:signal transduction histidine kinase